jgi:phage baseplate assembly protein W
MATNIKYSDIDLDFDAHPITGDVTRLVNESAIRRALRNIILMSSYESPFQPNKGSGIRELLFELPNTDTANDLEQRIRLVVDNYEPRVLISDVEVAVDEEGLSYNVTVWFSIVNEPDILTVDLTLSRIK